MSAIQSLDNYILIFIRNNMHNIFMDKAMVLVTLLGNGGFIWFAIGILLMINKKYRKTGLMTLASLLLAAILGELIVKNLFKRMRPFEYIISVKLLIPKPSSYSFPSGHAALSFAACGILTDKLKKYKFIFYALAVLIAFSRLYLFVHYPSDVFAGIILGVICSRIILYFQASILSGK